MTEGEFIALEDLTKVRTALTIIRDISGHYLNEKLENKLKHIIGDLQILRDEMKKSANIEDS